MTASPIRCMYPAPELPDASAVSPMPRRGIVGLSARLRHGWAAGRRFQDRPAALPLVLLLSALTTLFLFGGDREYFYRGLAHDWNSSQTLTFAENLSIRHNLLNFHYQSRDAAGNLQYPSVYNRFPLGGYVLVKLAIFPFGDTDFRAKIYAGRMLMLLLFSAAAVLAYAALARISGSRWDALAAILLAFSSYYMLYYADKISNEVTIDLFAVMLAFHGMTIFVQEGRFRQLVIKSCIALLLGWHVYAFLLPFIAFGLAAELLKARRFPPPPILGRLKRYSITLLRSRYLLLGWVTLLFGTAVLTFNFGNEYFALNQELPIQELPSIRSVVKRLNLSEAANARYSDMLAPQVFWPEQFERIAQATLPFAINILLAGAEPTPNFRYLGYIAAVIGALTLIFCLAGLAAILVRGRTGTATLLASLIFSGFCYAAMLRNNVAVHDFESVFYIGLPLTAYTLALLCLRRVPRMRLAPYFAIAALAVFIFSVSAIAGLGQSRAELAVEAEEMAEYGAIRDLADANQTIYVPARYLGTSDAAPYAWAFYLSGENLVFNDGYAPRQPQQAVDYLLMHTREDSPALLTPEHRHIFLYDWTLYNEWHRTSDLGRPVVAGDWQVYFRGGHLTYVSPECANQDALFFLHFVAKNAADLPSGRQGQGYENADFAFRYESITLADGTCVIERPLPDYDISAIRTGQYTEAGRIWEREYRLPSH